MSEFIRLENVTKGYPKLQEPVLKNLNLKLRAADRVVILGASGSGKTTLLHLLGLILQPDTGRVLIDGDDSGKWSKSTRASWRRSNLGYVFQDFGLVPELSLVENVELPARIGQRPLPQQKAASLLAGVGLAGRKNAFPSEVSGGESQRAAIARALVNTPRLVLADEPTGNLQRSQAAQIARLFLEFQAQQRFCLVVATHNEELAQLLEARTFRLVEGKLQAV